MLFILLMSLLIILIIFSEPVYAMDPLTQPRFELLAKISKVEDNIQYFAHQAKATDHLFKQALRDNLPEDMRQERLIAKKESEINIFFLFIFSFHKKKEKF